jgi:hypothetical protein
MKNIIKIIKPVSKIEPIKKILTISGYSKISYSTDNLDCALFIYEKNGNQVNLFIDDFANDVQIMGNDDTNIMDKIDEL